MKICIDAGHNHSGIDTGAAAGGVKEQDITYAIALILKEELTNAGITVVMTRNQNTENLGKSVSESIKTRARISNENHCDYFVSIHCNAGGGTGCEVLVYKKGGEAQKLAQPVLEGILAHLPLRSRGVKEANLGVLRDTKCPAILVELAFLDHPSDVVFLKNRQADFARGIAVGILSYLGMDVSHRLDAVKAFLKEKWQLSDPQPVWRLLDSHPFRNELYEKIYQSYEKE